jgi:hypothetical protein
MRYFYTWLIGCGLALGAGLPLAVAQEKLNAEGFPADWQTPDFNFTMLEPAAGEPNTVSEIGPTVSGTLAVSEAHVGLVKPSATVAIGPRAQGPQSFTIDQLPRVSLTSSATIALPPPASVMNVPSDTTLFKPLGQTLPQQRPSGIAADLGIIVNEQAVGGPQGGLASLASFGPLSSGAAAPDDVWQRADVATQSTRLSAASAQPVHSMALREAYRRLLLASVAVPPVGKTTEHWLAVRAEALENLGWYEAAWSLWREAGPLLRQPNTPPALLQGWARASLLAGQTEAACALVREQAAAGMVSDFWPSAAAVCAAAELNQSGSPAALALAIQLLPTRVMQTDPALITALGAVRDGTSPTLGGAEAKAWPVGALAGAAFAAAPRLLTDDMVKLLPDLALRRIRESQALPLSVRETAALRLIEQTAWPEDANRWLQMVSSPTMPRVAQAAWPDAAVVVWAQQISGTEGVATSSDSRAGIEEAAPRVVTAALRLGMVPLAQAWWPQWQSQTGLDAAGLRMRLQGQLALQFAQKQSVDTTFAAWLAARSTEPLASQRVLAVLEGVGVRISGTAWAQVMSVENQPDTLNLAWQRLLEAAAEQQDLPAVLSMVSEALRGQNAASASPGVLKASLQALRAVGAAEAAQRLAAEALTLPPSTLRAARILALDEGSAPLSLVKPALSPSVKIPQPTKPVAPQPPLLGKPSL